MMNARLLTACLLAGSVFTSLAARAGDIEQPYLALDYSIHTYQNANASASDANPTAVRVRAGSVISKYLAVEAHAAIGSSDDEGTITTPGGSVAYKISAPIIYGVFLRPQVKAGPLSLYALGGYAVTVLEFEQAGGASEDVDDSNFAYGGGAQIDVDKHWGLSADFVHYADGLDTISGGAVYRF